MIFGNHPQGYKTKRDRIVLKLSQKSQAKSMAPAASIDGVPVIGPRRALVVFTPAARPWWLCWIDPAIGHCFVVVEDRKGWIVVDCLAQRLEIGVFSPRPESDLAAFYRDQGFEVMAATIADPPRRLAPPLPVTCVEIVKRTIGLHSWRIITPFQLLNYMKKYFQNGYKSLDIQN